MSGVASKLPGLQRSLSLIHRPHLRPQLERCGSIRRMHGSILHPRAPKIRHLNASHSLLIDLDRNILKVQELEQKVLELENQLLLREAKKACQSNAPSISELPDTRLNKCLVTEEERKAFQNRLLEARLKAEELARKTSLEEANILRSWHSKKLKEALEIMSTSHSFIKSQTFLPLHSQIAEDDNGIFNALNALVDIANKEEALMNPIDKLQQLVIERESIKQLIDDLKIKLAKADSTVQECHASLQNILSSRTALSLELKSSEFYLTPLLRQQQTNYIWIYGPNPIFSKARDIELAASLDNALVKEAFLRLEVSIVHAENGLGLAEGLLNKYKKRLASGGRRLRETETAIDNQVQVITEQEDAHLKGVSQAGLKAVGLTETRTADTSTLPNRMKD